jgi:hypothetical protein
LILNRSCKRCSPHPPFAKLIGFAIVMDNARGIA